MEKVIIAAIAKNGVIGNKGRLPWGRIEGDLPRFKDFTIGNIVIMGRKTFESLGKPLVNRTNIVVTRNRDFYYPGVFSAPSIEVAIRAAKAFSEEERDIFFTGGAQVYKEALQYADRMELTEVHKEYPGDTYFPEFDRDEWCETNRIIGKEADFVTYNRIK